MLILNKFARAIGAPMVTMIGMLAWCSLIFILDPILIFGFDLNVVVGDWVLQSVMLLLLCSLSL